MSTTASDRARLVSTAMIVATGAFVLTTAAFEAVGRPLKPADRLDPLYIALMAIGSALYLLIGRAIVVRQPRNAIGWLLLAVPVIVTFAFADGSYVTHTYAIDPGSLPFGRAAAWIDRWILVPALGAFIPVFLLYPDGRLPSRRWRPVGIVALVAPIVVVVGMAVTPGRLTGGTLDNPVHVTNPLGVPISRPTVELVTQLAGLAMLATAAAAFVGIVVRFRRSDPETRQQIRWLALVGGAFFADLVVALSLQPLGLSETAGASVVYVLLFVILMIGTPVACGIAILKYHLFDLDVVVRKTLVATLLVALLALVSSAILLTVGQFALWEGTPRGISVAVGIAVGGLLFGPLLRLARRIADRIVFGRRATPYEVLTDFSQRVADSYSMDDVLQRMASIVAAGTAAEGTSIWLLVDGVLREAAAWPQSAPTDARSGGVRAEEDRFEVRHRGDLLGAIGVSMPPSDPMSEAKARVVRDLAAQAGLVLRNVKLFEELRASRERLVAAQDEERRKLERNLHDGAQQQLVALAVQLRLAEQMAGTDTDKEREILHRLQAMTNEALEDLRDLARGIYPPLLADKGLAAALEAHARRSPVPVTIDADGVGRYPQAIESALYFCSLEALNNVAKYSRATSATIRLRRESGVLRAEVTDDGVGFDRAAAREGTGIRGMADRLEAIGGRLDVRSSPGAGTVVSAVVPVGEAEPR
jgi:signal transduction histidine kinase